MDQCHGDEGRWAIASPDLRDDEAFMSVTDALESIKDGNNGDRGVAIIVSPPVSGQYQVMECPGDHRILGPRQEPGNDGHW